MPRSARQALIDTAASRGDRLVGLAELLAILASAQNPDSSAYSLPVEAVPYPADRHESVESAANAQALIIWAAEADKAHHITAIEASYSARLPAGGVGSVGRLSLHGFTR